MKKPDVTTLRGRDLPLTRRMYLTVKAVQGGANFFLAAEAVSSTAIEHPEWDMDEVRVFSEWERS